MTSLPDLPLIVSRPRPPFRQSAPPRPVIVSRPPVPLMRSPLVLPRSTSADAVPTSVLAHLPRRTRTALLNAAALLPAWASVARLVTFTRVAIERSAAAAMFSRTVALAPGRSVPSEAVRWLARNRQPKKPIAGKGARASGGVVHTEPRYAVGVDGVAVSTTLSAGPALRFVTVSA